MFTDKLGSKKAEQASRSMTHSLFGGEDCLVMDHRIRPGHENAQRPG
jgi:hypothetical protein